MRVRVSLTRSYLLPLRGTASWRRPSQPARRGTRRQAAFLVSLELPEGGSESEAARGGYSPRQRQSESSSARFGDCESPELQKL